MTTCPRTIGQNRSCQRRSRMVVLAEVLAGLAAVQLLEDRLVVFGR